MSFMNKIIISLLFLGLATFNVEAAKQDVNGLVVLNATEYDSKIDTPINAWTIMVDGITLTSIDDGVNEVSGTNGASVSYNVEIVKSGTHYLWVRATNYVSASSDSLIYGVNESTTQDFTFFYQHEWANEHQSPARAIATIDLTPGVYTFTIWVREDGTNFQKIVLTTDPNLVPTDSLEQVQNDPNVCVPDGTCSAALPGCGITTNGVDSCGTVCSRTGAVCPNMANLEAEYKASFCKLVSQIPDVNCFSCCLDTEGCGIEGCTAPSSQAQLLWQPSWEL